MIQLKKQALSFSNPHIPYQWDSLDKIREGVFCVFDRQFFHQNADFHQYEVFRPNGSHIFELTDEQADWVEKVFAEMREELGSTYKYKFELIRILVLRLIHFALKLQPPEYAITKPRNAAQRIANLFMELLDRQFPLNEQNTKMYFRTPAEYSRQLNIHINYLNRVVKQTTGRTTSQIISDRILQEAKLMLKNNQHSVAEIAYSLGFAEASHFSNFFRKHQHTIPSKFRESI